MCHTNHNKSRHSATTLPLNIHHLDHRHKLQAVGSPPGPWLVQIARVRLTETFCNPGPEGRRPRGCLDFKTPLPDHTLTALPGHQAVNGA